MKQKKKEDSDILPQELAGTIIKTTPLNPDEGEGQHPDSYNQLSAVAGKIVPKSYVSSISSAAPKSPGAIHNRLHELHKLDKKKREKNEAIRQANIRKEESKCTFKPKISKGSSKYQRPASASGYNTNPKNPKKNQKRIKSPSVFDKLYEKSKKEPPKEKSRKQVVEEEFFSECTFKPDIK